MDRVHRPNLGPLPSLQESVIYWAQISTKEMYLLFLAWLTLGRHCHWPCFWHVEARTAIWRHLRVLGVRHPVGCAVFGPGPLLGLYEGQPPCPELLLSSTMTHRLCLAPPWWGQGHYKREPWSKAPSASMRGAKQLPSFSLGRGRKEPGPHLGLEGWRRPLLAICFPPRAAVFRV